ncbi:MAG TPA: glycine oxidase ThiO [Planctomycetaceae bacterium]|nr:glycine oxidase ThiO [Planctomycetaceae bacterium]
MVDVLIIGGGAIGLSTAWELAGAGRKVCVVEQGAFGMEASWAGAGMLRPGHCELARTREARLRAHSHRLWPEWSSRLRETTGIDNGYVRCGALEVRSDGNPDSLGAEISAWRNEGVAVEPVNADDLRRRFPAVGPRVTSAYFQPELGQIRNPRHMKALLIACEQRGVELRPGCPVSGFEHQGGKITAVRTIAGPLSAAEYLVTGGAWTGNLLATLGLSVPVKPIRGQIVLLQQRPLTFRCVIQEGHRYLVPRPDGRVLIGATEEDVGFNRQTTASAVAGLIQFACDVVPDLASASVEQSWAGLRPHAPDGLPFLGRVAGWQNLSIAAGHYRNGLEMSPITAVLMRQLLLGEPLTLPDECKGLADASPIASL